MNPLVHCDVSPPLIRLFSASPLFSIGLMKLMPEANDEVTPIIHQQTLGTHAVVLVTKTSLHSMRDSVLSWMNGTLQPRKGNDSGVSLCVKEWTALNRYLLVHDMHAVVAWMNISTKNAYYWRKRALKNWVLTTSMILSVFIHHVTHSPRH